MDHSLPDIENIDIKTCKNLRDGGCDAGSVHASNTDQDGSYQINTFVAFKVIQKMMAWIDSQTL